MKNSSYGVVATRGARLGWNSDFANKKSRKRGLNRVGILAMKGWFFNDDCTFSVVVEGHCAGLYLAIGFDHFRTSM